MESNFKASDLFDSLASFENGVYMGVAPELLPRNQMANAVNVTVRGTYAVHRPSVKRVALNFSNNPSLQAAFESAIWQGGCYYQPDNASGTLLAAISGKLFQLTLNSAGGMDVTERSASGTEQQSNAVQHWLWQSEKWVIWNDGVSNPVFFDGATCSRSTWNTPVKHSRASNVTPLGDLTIPAVGSTSAAVAFSTNGVANMNLGDLVTLPNKGTLAVQTISGTNVTFLNIDAGPVGQVIAGPFTISWIRIGADLAPGRMGVYGLGRNWMSLIDGKQFVASDLVGGASGTQAQSYRDAVLKITENLQLAGGGTFMVPGSVGDIKAMRFDATLDASLGQGALQVLTAKTVFSCQAPVDRLTWQNLSNPILTESLISNGGLSQNSTVMANGDLLFRSVDGIRSLILGRRDFNTWGNVPASREVNPILDSDDVNLLQYSSAVIFDNRLLMTTKPTSSIQGVYHRGLVALNFDPLSSLRGKQASVYDGLWTGLNIFQIVTGDFNNEERCFAFTLNTISHTLELYELLKTDKEHYDNGDGRITWGFESPVLFGKSLNPNRHLLRLSDGEIFIDNLLGNVDFKVFYKPDQWPCWVPWHSWRECARQPTTDPATAGYKPQFRPALGLGEPSASDCDETNNRVLREGFWFQVKILVTGHCRFLGARFRAVTQPLPTFSKKTCVPIPE